MIENKLIAAVHRWIERLIAPNPELATPELRDRARLMAAAYLLMWLMSLVMFNIRSWLMWESSTPLGNMVRLISTNTASIIMLLCYFMVKNGKIQPSVYVAAVTITISAGTTIIAAPLNTAFAQYFLVFNVLFVAVFGRIRDALIINVFHVFFLFTVNALNGIDVVKSANLGAITFSISIGSIVLVMLLYVKRIEEAQRHRLTESEGRFRMALAGGLDPFLLFRALRGSAGKIYDFELIEVNHHGEIGLPAPKEQLYGKPFFANSSTLYQLDVFELFCKTVEQQQPYANEMFSAQDDRWFYLVLVPTPDGLAVTSRDITDRKRTEQALMESQAIFHEITEHIDEIFYIRDTVSNRLLYISPGYETLWGRSAAELYKRPLAFLSSIHPEDVPKILEAARIEERDGTPINMEYRYVASDGQVRLLWARNFPVYDDQGKLIRMIGVAKDITERREYEEKQLEFAIQRERVELLQRFVGDLSHDLMTPITVVKTSLYLLTKTDDPDQRRERIHRIEKQVNHLQSIIEDMLTLSRLDRPLESEFHFYLQDINGFVDDIVRELLPQAVVNKQTLSFIPDPNLSKLMIDVHKMHRALNNLVTNAMRYTPEGGKITVKTGMSAGGALISVSDNGHGIPQSEHALIFERFYRGQQHRPDGGSGLGLAITKKIIEGHSGTIHVESQLGHGATFIITLPLPPTVSTTNQHQNAQH